MNEPFRKPQNVTNIRQIGKNIEFIENKKIVQQWYFGDQLEESMVTFLLHPDKNGTSLELRHTNIPDSDFKDMIDGWNLNYFGALQDFYEDQPHMC